MLTDFYNISHRVHWDNMQHKSYWFAHITYIMLLHYLGKIISSFQRFESCFLGYNVVALKRAGFGAEMRMQTWRWTVIAYARSDHHWQPQPCRQSCAWWSSPILCWCVFVAALPRWSTKRFSTHRLSWAPAEVYGSFPAWCPDVIVPQVQFGVHRFFSMNL